MEIQVRIVKVTCPCGNSEKTPKRMEAWKCNDCNRENLVKETITEELMDEKKYWENRNKNAYSERMD